MAPAAAETRGPLGLSTPIGRSGLPGVTPLRRHGRRLGIETVGDLLTTFPRRYEDLREFSRLGDLSALEPGTPVTVRATVASLRVEKTFRRRVQRTIAVLRADGAECQAVWFGRRFIERQIHEGDHLILSGKVKLRGWQAQLDNPEFQLDDGGDLLHAGRIVPIYRLTRGVTAKSLRAAIRAGLDAYGDQFEPDYLEPGLRDGHPEVRAAITAAHFPDDFEQRDAAVRRLAHDELLALQVGMVQRRRQRDEETTRAPLAVEEADSEHLRASVTAGLRRATGREVELTADQRSAMDAIRDDVAGSVPMLRLLQGDVGSGKTAVAAYALGLASTSGGQGALLAPTDLLARQLAETVAGLLADAGVAVVLLTGSLSAAGRKAAHEAVATGQAQVVVGTHALLQESVSYARLDLVVIDEQHRFGVAQREALAAKGVSPHVLLMTATPIPRTLGQVLYADLDVSDLRSAPSGRPATLTGVKVAHDLAGTWSRVQQEAAAGHRTFVVVPHIDPQGSDEGDDAAELPPSLPATDGFAEARGAEEVHERLARQLAPARVGLVHGRMRAQDREAEMARFRDGAIDVLVGTTVVEVGVDVPEATLMIVLNADRFGLSQLHQLRGRVGRGTAQSYCVLVADISEDTVARARLKAIHDSDDGFALAEEDWRLRGEGDVLGLSQSGLPRMRLVSLSDERDRALAVECRRLAEGMVDAHGRLDPRHAAFARAMTEGWLAEIAAGEGSDGEAIGA
ncbi:MAG: ATP-dependent DNA helicase RecG [Candidatus Limnocylindrales bacterium]